MATPFVSVPSLAISSYQFLPSLSLLNQTRRVPNIKNRVDEKVEQAVVKFALDFPAYGQVRVSNELRKQGIFVSAGGVRSIWLRHNLANFKQRLNALEKEVAEKGIILSESQVQALERKKDSPSLALLFSAFQNRKMRNFENRKMQWFEK